MVAPEQCHTLDQRQAAQIGGEALAEPAEDEVVKFLVLLLALIGALVLFRLFDHREGLVDNVRRVRHAVGRNRRVPAVAQLPLQPAARVVAGGVIPRRKAEAETVGGYEGFE